MSQHKCVGFTVFDLPPNFAMQRTSAHSDFDLHAGRRSP
jgi:hypothetical protein